MIHVIATIQVAPGRRDDFLREFHALVPLVRDEKGCLEYGPTIDLPTGHPAQPAARPDVVTIVEKWVSPEALADHLAAPHMAEYRARVRHLVQNLELRVLTPV